MQFLNRNRPFRESLSCALEGLVVAFKTQHNMHIHTFLSCLVVSFGIYFQISRWEWVALLSAIFSVFITELLNTAIEDAIDLMTQEHHHLAKSAKDIAAAAVLIAALYSLCIAYLIFFDRLATLILEGVHFW